MSSNKYSFHKLQVKTVPTSHFKSLGSLPNSKPLIPSKVNFFSHAIKCRERFPVEITFEKCGLFLEFLNTQKHLFDSSQLEQLQILWKEQFLKYQQLKEKAGSRSKSVATIDLPNKIPINRERFWVEENDGESLEMESSLSTNDNSYVEKVNLNTNTRFEVERSEDCERIQNALQKLGKLLTLEHLFKLQQKMHKNEFLEIESNLQTLQAFLFGLQTHFNHYMEPFLRKAEFYNEISLVSTSTPNSNNAQQHFQQKHTNKSESNNNKSNNTAAQNESEIKVCENEEMIEVEREKYLQSAKINLSSYKSFVALQSKFASAFLSETLWKYREVKLSEEDLDCWCELMLDIHTKFFAHQMRFCCIYNFQRTFLFFFERLVRIPTQDIEHTFSQWLNQLSTKLTIFLIKYGGFLIEFFNYTDFNQSSICFVGQQRNSLHPLQDYTIELLSDEKFQKRVNKNSQRTLENFYKQGSNVKLFASDQADSKHGFLIPEYFQEDFNPFQMNYLQACARDRILTGLVAHAGFGFLEGVMIELNKLPSIQRNIHVNSLESWHSLQQIRDQRILLRLNRWSVKPTSLVKDLFQSLSANSNSNSKSSSTLQISGGCSQIQSKISTYPNDCNHTSYSEQQPPFNQAVEVEEVEISEDLMNMIKEKQAQKATQIKRDFLVIQAIWRQLLNEFEQFLITSDSEELQLIYRDSRREINQLSYYLQTNNPNYQNLLIEINSIDATTNLETTLETLSASHSSDKSNTTSKTNQNPNPKELLEQKSSLTSELLKQQVAMWSEFQVKAREWVLTDLMRNCWDARYKKVINLEQQDYSSHQSGEEEIAIRYSYIQGFKAFIQKKYKEFSIRYPSEYQLIINEKEMQITANQLSSTLSQLKTTSENQFQTLNSNTTPNQNNSKLFSTEITSEQDKDNQLGKELEFQNWWIQFTKSNPNTYNLIKELESLYRVPNPPQHHSITAIDLLRFLNVCNRHQLCFENRYMKKVQHMYRAHRFSAELTWNSRIFKLSNLESRANTNFVVDSVNNSTDLAGVKKPRSLNRKEYLAMLNKRINSILKNPTLFSKSSNRTHYISVSQESTQHSLSQQSIQSLSQQSRIEMAVAEAATNEECLHAYTFNSTNKENYLKLLDMEINQYPKESKQSQLDYLQTLKTKLFEEEKNSPRIWAMRLLLSKSEVEINQVTEQIIRSKCLGQLPKEAQKELFEILIKLNIQIV